MGNQIQNNNLQITQLIFHPVELAGLEKSIKRQLSVIPDLDFSISRPKMIIKAQGLELQRP
jgi:hypothetical protein